MPWATYAQWPIYLITFFLFGFICCLGKFQNGIESKLFIFSFFSVGLKKCVKKYFGLRKFDFREKN